MSLDPALSERLQSIVSSAPVVLFMKGHPGQPQCGFSSRVVEILNRVLPSYESVDVLSHPEIRDGIKVFSDWPTIPQLYVGGEFQGGCDIITEMYGNGELHKALGLEAPAGEAPALVVTEAASTFLQEAAKGQPGELHLTVDAAFRHGMYFAPPTPGMLASEIAGLTLYFDPDSAARAQGLEIHYDEAEGGQLRIENPNAPKVAEMTVEELSEKLAAGSDLVLLDVRPEEERSRASLEAARPLDDEILAELGEGPKDRPLVLLCHHGSRSLRVAQRLVQQGYTAVFNLEGGIDAWSQKVDDSVPRY